MGNFTSTAGATFTPSDAFFLCEAARTGAVDIVRLFLKKNFGLVYAANDSDKSTPWHVAAAAGHDFILRVLIDTTRANAVSNNFDPLSNIINKQTANGQTALMLACGGGHSVCVRLLLESGAHLLMADAMGRSALHYAALHCRADDQGNDCVDLLLGHMTQQLILQGPVKAPPAVHANVIRKFADAADMYGRTALHCAAWSGNIRAVHALWAVGADIVVRTDTDCYDSDLPCNKGTTPLHYAAMRGHQHVVVLLLAAWHRMASRPWAPLPRPAFFAAVLQSLPQRLTRAAAAMGSGPAAAAAGRGSAAERPQQQPVGSAQKAEEGLERDEKGLVTESEEGSSPQGGEVEEGAPGDAAKNQDILAASVRTDLDASNDELQQQEKQQEKEHYLGDRDRAVRGSDQGQGEESGIVAAAVPGESTGPAVSGARERNREPDPAGSNRANGATAAAPEGSGSQAVPEASTRASAQASEGGDGADSSSSGRSSSVESMDWLTGPSLELPPPPRPRPPAMDPRLMMDAYGMTPYTIAGKRKQDRGSMLLELLDPTTDFGAIGSSSCSDSDGEKGGDDVDSSANAGGGSVAGRRQKGRGSGRRRGRDVDDDDGDDRNDDDADSVAAEAGPLLLWEGVELVRDIAADPEGFFRMQQTVSLLKPQLPDEDGASKGRGGGEGLVGTRTAMDGRRSSAGGGGRPPLTSTTTEVVPDCFLCPLTCKMFWDPVVASDGVTYEREAIERHLRLVNTSPVTKQRLPSKQLYDNNALRSAMEHWSAGLLPPRGVGSTGMGGGGAGNTRKGASRGLFGRP